MTESIESGGESRALLRAFVEEQWAAFLPRVSEFQWPLESARWHEMVFCLLRYAGRPEITSERARRLTGDLVDLGLVEVGHLAAMAGADGAPEPTNPGADLLRGVLVQAGLGAERAQVALVTLVEAAGTLQARHDGRIQRLLRAHAEAFLTEVSATFAFSRLPAESARLALTLWLQNVTTLPLELWDRDVVEFCRQFGCTREDLVAVADDLDLNLALVDDVLGAFVGPDVANPSDMPEHAAGKP